MDYYENQDELYHYGRKGMKWGQHIFGEVKKAGSKVGRKVSDSWKQHKEKKAAERIMSKPISKLTDAELKQRIERLKLEQNASQLMSNIRNNNSTGEGKKFMSNLKNRIGEGIADAAKATITDYAKKQLFKVFHLSDEMSEEIKQLTKEADEWGLRGKIAENMSKQLKYDKDKEDWDKNHPKNDSNNGSNNKPKSDGDASTNKPKDDSNNKPKSDGDDSTNKPKSDGDASTNKPASNSKSVIDRLNDLVGGKVKTPDTLDTDESSNMSSRSSRSGKSDDYDVDSIGKDTGSTKSWDRSKTAQAIAKKNAAHERKVAEAEANRREIAAKEADDEYKRAKASLEKVLGMSVKDAVAKQSRLDSYASAKRSIDSILSGGSDDSHARDVTRTITKAITGNYSSKYSGTSFAVAKASPSVASTTTALAGLFGGGYTKQHRNSIASKRAAKITSNNASRAKAMRSSGKSYEEIAKQLGVSVSSVSDYLN